MGKDYPSKYFREIVQEKERTTRLFLLAPVSRFIGSLALKLEMVGTNQLLILGSSLVKEQVRNRLFATYVLDCGKVYTRAACRFPMISRTRQRLDYVTHGASIYRRTKGIRTSFLLPYIDPRTSFSVLFLRQLS